MNDADFIESIAAFHDQKEIYYRSVGMFELAEWCQWAAASTRCRQLVHGTRGSGGSSIAIYLSDNYFLAVGDMTPEQALDAGAYLTREAHKKAGPETTEAEDYLAVMGDAVAILQGVISHLKPKGGS